MLGTIIYDLSCWFGRTIWEESPCCEENGGKTKTTATATKNDAVLFYRVSS